MMEEIKQLKELSGVVKESGKSFLRIEQYCSRSSGLRIFWTSIVSGLFLYLTFAYVIYERGDGYNEKLKPYNEKVTSLSNQNQLQLSLSKIVLCKAKQHEEPILRDWYCFDAIEAYKATYAKSSDKTRVDTVVKKNAFGTMEIEIENLILREKQVQPQMPTLPFFVKFWKPFSDNQLGIFCFFIVVTIAFFYLQRLDRLSAKDVLPKLDV